MNPTHDTKVTGFGLVPETAASKDKDNDSINAAYHYHIEMMQRAGIACKLPMKTINTAIMAFLRYFKSKDICTDNPKHAVSDICRCCLFTATKSEETPCDLRDIINATHKIQFPNKKLVLQTDPMWSQWKEQLLDLECIILEDLHFEFNAVHPHQFVLHQLKQLRCSKTVAKVAWSICNDVMFSRHIMLCFAPHEISTAAIYVAVEYLAKQSPQLLLENDENVQIVGSKQYALSPVSPKYEKYHAQNPYDLTKKANWWRLFSIKDETVKKIGHLIMDIYESKYAQLELKIKLASSRKILMKQ